MDAMSTTSSSSQKSHNLFQVFLRLRPPQADVTSADRFLAVEPPAEDAVSSAPTHITLNPPNDRRRAIEKFAFTQVFEEDASQLDLFHCTNVVPLVEGVLAPHGGDGTDALLATLGVTGSGKTHTILGSRSQRGMTQLALDLIFRSIGSNIVDCSRDPSIEASITRSDASEASIFTASAFLETVFADASGPSRANSRAPTPMIVRPLASRMRSSPSHCLSSDLFDEEEVTLPMARSASVRMVRKEDYTAICSSPSPPVQKPVDDAPAGSRGNVHTPTGRRHPLQTRSANKPTSPVKHFMNLTASMQQKTRDTKTAISKGEQYAPPPTPRRLLNRPSALSSSPDISSINASCDPSCDYTVVVSMYEVYNDRIFDLLTPPIKSAATKEYRRRPLLFKSTELSPDRKVVAGLRKVICSNFNQAMMVLEAGLHERRVAGTGSNSVSSRSHGFFCVEVKKRSSSKARRHGDSLPWGGSTLTIVDLAGSERARDAKTAGATLAEAGKINESLMYLGQCLQMQSDAGNTSKPNVVPFRQCKLTELLFSNSFPSPSFNQSHSVRRNPQKAVMIVTADPHGDFNATSQILRYSALAREVTVPRIPSITQTILSANANACSNFNNHPQPCSSPISSPPLLHNRPFFPPGSTTAPHIPPSSPNIQRTFSPASAASEDRATMEIAALEIARLSEEIDYLRDTLNREHESRVSAEAHLLSMEDRMLELEQAVREDCVAEFEQRLAVELARWKAGMQVEIERGEEHWDRKIEVFERSLGVQVIVTGATTNDDEVEGENKENVLVEDLQQENDRLRREMMVLKRELAGRSPSKRVPLSERDDVATGTTPRASKGGDSLQRKMEKLRVSEDGGRGSSASRREDSTGSPKKMRKLTAKRWESGADEDLF